MGALFLALAGAVLLWASGAGAQTVTDLRVGKHADKTRFVMDLTGKVDFRVFGLVDPYRIVIDFPELGWQLPARPLPARVGAIQSLRYGLFRPGASRVVLDLAGPVAIDAAFLLPPAEGRGSRFVLDLKPAAHEEFLASLVRGRHPAPTPAPPEVSDQAALPPVPSPGRKPGLPGAGGRKVVVIDPGHGGVDPGAIGRSGVLEKDITLGEAKVLKARLERTGRYRVVMTREKDIFIPLRGRIKIAREAGAELFISLHANTIRKSSIRGLSVYTLSERASDKEAANLAESENKADLIAGMDLSEESPEVTNILIDLAQRETMNESSRFAADLVGELRRVTRLLRKTHRFAGFAVLKAPDVPSVLIELGFLSNPGEEHALRTARYRAQLADAVAGAIDTYFARVEQATRF